MTLALFDSVTLTGNNVVDGNLTVIGTAALAALSASGAATFNGVSTFNGAASFPGGITGTPSFAAMIAQRLSSAAQAAGTFTAGVAQNLFALADGDSCLILITTRSGTDGIYFGLVTRNVNLYQLDIQLRGMGVITFSMSSGTLKVASSTSNVGFLYSFIRFPAF